MKKQQMCTILLSSLLLTACMATAVQPLEPRPQKWGQLIEQSDNFYKVSDTVYRSDQPDQQFIAKLKQHQIYTVINLRHSDKDQKVFVNQSIQLVHIPIHTWAMNRQDLLHVMQSIQTAQQQQQQVLVHCYHGSDRTGASIAMYRIIFENWSTADALNEMKYGGYGFHTMWSNLEKLFTPENIKWIRQQLTNPS